MNQERTVRRKNRGTEAKRGGLGYPPNRVAGVGDPLRAPLLAGGTACSTGQDSGLGAASEAAGGTIHSRILFYSTARATAYNKSG